MFVKVFWGIVVGFLLGVFLRSLLPLGLSFAGFAALLGVAILAIVFLERKKQRAGIIIAAALFACALGIVRMDVGVVPRDAALDAHLGEKVIVEGVVFAEPDARESSTRVFVRADTFVGDTASTSVRAGVLVVGSAHADISYGDRVRAEGVLRLPEAFETVGGRAFDYPGFLAKDGVLYQLAFASIERVGEGPRNPLKAVSIYLKQRYLEGIALALSEPHGGLAGGITAGDKRGVGEELGEVFRVVSLTHIVVLSGYNIMIVVIGLGWVLARVRVGRWLEFALGVSVAAFFALMTGLASASVRAAAMASIAMAGKASGRAYLASRALGLVAAAMVLWNPYVLVYDIGFQLSIAATWGLIALSPIVSEKLSFVTERLALREIAAATIATQIAVLPLLLYQSGELSIYALPVNLLVLVVVPYAMLFSALAALAGLALGSLAPVVALPALALLGYILGVAQLFAALPFASVALPAFGAWWLLPVYAILVWIGRRNASDLRSDS